MLPTPYVAALRVFEPIDLFSPQESEMWKRATLNSDTKRLEQNKALTSVIQGGSILPQVDGAHFLEVDGKSYVSPWSTELRMWAALQDFKTSLPSNVVRFFFSDSLPSEDRETLRPSHSMVAHTLTETWIVPPRWFSLFEPVEMLIVKNENVITSIARTPISKAKKRCLEAHGIVRNAFGEGPVEDEIAQLLNWLNVFDDGSIVELDYGGLARYLDLALRNNGKKGIEADTSIEDVQLSLIGLRNGDGASAGRGYERLVTRWRDVAAFESAI